MIGGVRAFVGRTVVTRSRSYRAALSELAELRDKDASYRVAQLELAQLQEKDASAQLELVQLREKDASAQLELVQLREEDAAYRAAQLELAQLRDQMTSLTAECERLRKQALQQLAMPAEQREPKLPSIFLAAIPKSGGAYINNTLLKGLNFSHYDVTVGVFPNDLIIWDRWPAYDEGNKVAHHHLEASTPNLWYIKIFQAKLVIHMRDPRAVLLSWIHHLSAATREAELLPHAVIAPPDEYYSKPLSWKISWTIEHHLQVFVRWIEQWLDAEPTYHAQLLFTRYEDFVRDRASFINRILSFYDIPTTHFVDPVLPLIRELNFRTGRVAEWREVFDAQQRRLASSRIPDRLYERFQWNADPGGVGAGIEGVIGSDDDVTMAR